MLNNLILAAAEAGATQGVLEKFGLGDFGIEGRYIVLQLIGFLIFFAVVYFKIIKPVIGTMEERQEKIDAGIKHAEEMKTKLDAAQVESAEIIKTAQGEASKIIDEARQSAKAFMEKQTQEATTKAQEIITKAQHATELEHRKMIAEARGEIARLVVATTRQVLAKELSDDERKRYNDAAAKELTVA
ncbi:F0F1 ATP synthase subunit B [Actomonas aquatica]|uniref:ATP synthase subunit b n=1 Tax=Actomonas aquatica TaxID=2866162 RepID=A0ABZ1C3T6_9BACT|nr:F0F1 ATP synthase subunit B [Opitutus sp. WL0086]WRQ86116.1 F0F1 ATP synthase subunit B [Opitutus sp. WL0086]